LPWEENVSDTHRQAADQHELAAHAHRTAAEHNEKGKNELGNWHLERAMEYSDHAYKLAKEAHSKSGQMESLDPTPALHDTEPLYQNHSRAAELHDRAADAHRVAQKHEKGDEITGQKHSHQALYHSQAADKLTKAIASGYGVVAFAHDEIATLAYELWQARGCPYGSPEEDWLRAESELHARAAKQ
jgi:Protein of unknown function (DUF2934)